MRAGRAISAAAFGLAVCAAAVLTARSGHAQGSYSQGSYPQGSYPQGGAGCLGYPLDACLASLRATLAVDESFIAASVARRHRVDVNGRSLGSGLVSVSAKLPGRLEPVMILVHVGADDRVTAIETTLLGDPLLARTETEYDQTGLYPLTLRLVGQRCAEITSPLAVYRFFENSVKPAIQRNQENIRGGILGGHRRTEASPPLPFCGVRFSYGGQVQWSGPLDLNFGRNITTVYTIKIE